MQLALYGGLIYGKNMLYLTVDPIQQVASMITIRNCISIPYPYHPNSNITISPEIVLLSRNMIRSYFFTNEDARRILSILFDAHHFTQQSFTSLVEMGVAQFFQKSILILSTQQSVRWCIFIEEGDFNHLNHQTVMHIIDLSKKRSHSVLTPFLARKILEKIDQNTTGWINYTINIRPNQITDN